MKKFLSSASAAYLLVLMLIKTMGMEIAVLDYTFHKDFIAATLCENRDKPEMKCAGKCYLKKQLAQSNENADAQQTKGGSKNFSVDFFESKTSTAFSARPTVFSHHSYYLQQRRDHPFVSGVFHPPLIAVL